MRYLTGTHVRRPGRKTRCFFAESAGWVLLTLQMVAEDDVDRGLEKGIGICEILFYNGCMRGVYFFETNGFPLM